MTAWVNRGVLAALVRAYTNLLHIIRLHDRWVRQSDVRREDVSTVPAAVRFAE